MPYQGQFDPITPNFPHQRRTLLVGGREIRLRIEKRPCFGEKFHPQIGQPVEFSPSIGEGFQEDRNVIIALPMRIAAGA